MRLRTTSTSYPAIYRPWVRIFFAWTPLPELKISEHHLSPHAPCLLMASYLGKYLLIPKSARVGSPTWKNSHLPSIYRPWVCLSFRLNPAPSPNHKFPHNLPSSYTFQKFLLSPEICKPWVSIFSHLNPASLIRNFRVTSLPPTLLDLLITQNSEKYPLIPIQLQWLSLRLLSHEYLHDNSHFYLEKLMGTHVDHLLDTSHIFLFSPRNNLDQQFVHIFERNQYIIFSNNLVWWNSRRISI